MRFYRVGKTLETQHNFFGLSMVDTKSTYLSVAAEVSKSRSPSLVKQASRSNSTSIGVSIISILELELLQQELGVIRDGATNS